ncbi:PTS sugar transporter subunit IIA [Streptococcus merionis]|uniref:PTS system enzyme IIA component n=1 Tax=Streptococcus merionis TaxID=400065 RepID=A0A239T058_9STRE|nr:PTS sugar transporter subunit IIA [Streptococcus merionis]SNU91165.1 PTS system enzyme IIA component [Streptococcus merionis]
MSVVPELVKDELIQLSCTASNKLALLETLSDDLIQKDYVRETFKNAIIEREEEFPTGLQLEGTAVAIPHTYAEHVKKPFIYIARMVSPVTFVQMGTDDVEVLASYVIVLGISDPQKQIGLLVELMELFGNLSFLMELGNADSIEEIKKLFTTIQ